MHKLNRDILSLYKKNKNLFLDYKISRKGMSDYNYFSFPDFPSFLDQENHRLIMEACHHVHMALQYSISLLLQSRLKLDGIDLKEFLDIPEYIFDWIKKEDLNRLSPVFWGRPDFVMGKDGPCYIEANLASAAGYQMQVSGLLDYYLDHPMFGKLLEKDNILWEDPLLCMAQSFARNIDPRELILFTDIYEEYRHRSKKNRPYSGMIQLLVEVTGLNIKSAYVDELESKGGNVYYGDDLIKNIFLSYYNPHVFEHDEIYQKLWQFKKTKKIFCLDSMFEILYSNKILFAFISEFVDEMPFHNSIKKGFSEYVPWSRIIRDYQCSFSGEKLPMEKLLIKFQQNMVLKKAQSAESKEVFLGHQTSEKVWKERVTKALNEGGWIAQEIVECVTETFYEITEKGLEESSCDFVLSPYLSEGQFSGYLKRYIKGKGLGKTDTNVRDNLKPELATSFIIT